jgi:hypothetical protein
VSKFPKVTSDKEQGLSKSVTDMIKDALKDIFPKGPTTFGANPKSTKIESTGDAHGTGVIGYRNIPRENRNNPRKKEKEKA